MMMKSEEFDYSSAAKQMHKEWLESDIDGKKVPWDKLSRYAKRKWRKKAYDKWLKEKVRLEAQNQQKATS